MATLRTLVLLLLALACLPGALQAQTCLSADMTATPTAPGSGLWKYCLTIHYDVSALKHAPSHFDLILASLTDCPCACGPGAIAADASDVVATGIGPVTELPCKVTYESDVNCAGDPTLPQYPHFTIKWDVAKGSACEPAQAGSETFCFVSALPPGAPSTTTAAIKLARLSCIGTVSGTLPQCDCATPVHPGTWGRVKSLYR
jgi:hypothetical protein